MNSDYNALRAAIETEIDGYRFFLDASSKSASDKVQNVWLSLANDEIEHMRILQKHLSTIVQSGDWGEYREDMTGPLPEKAPITTPAGPLPPAPFADDVEALEAGLKVEENTWRFYARVAGEATSPAAKSTYNQLARMEMGHYDLISETILMLKDPAQWQLLQTPIINEG